MNALVDALSGYGVEHLDMPGDAGAGVGGDADRAR